MRVNSDETIRRAVEAKLQAGLPWKKMPKGRNISIPPEPPLRPRIIDRRFMIGAFVTLALLAIGAVVGLG